ncbi:LacI family DNA-binding transcriptional regulator [Poriferisphaera sp. WC338]|uniref:LacI family DNA-binding transcriptional regulator n=1 Tax=Poriferisphaera sp. WC338 TaxID=3425129 RepID=UPI003D81501E
MGKVTSKKSGGSISIADVARHAEVSIGTVSRVINRHPSVASELRRKVLVSSRELGFVPKVARRCIALVTGRHSPGLPIGYVSVMTSLVSQELASRGYAVELIDIANLELAYESHVDGVIGIVFDKRLVELRAIPNLPMVTINKPLIEHGIHGVYADHYQQAVDACRHLIERGHDKIAYLEIESNEWGSQERLRGYRDALEDAGLPFDAERVCYTSEQPIYDILSRWCQKGMTGLLNFSEDVGLEVLHILGNVLGKKIGKDISTISLEDFPVYQYLTPPQTVVRQPLAKLAKLAVEHVLQPVSEAADIANVQLPTELVIRDSVATIGEAVTT